MEDYKNYTAEDFVLDPEFKAWVKTPTPESDAFWSQWQQAHPDKQRIIQQAILIAQNFPVEDSVQLSPADRQHLMLSIEAGIDALQSKIRRDKEGAIVPLKINPATQTPGSKANIYIWAWGVAASLLLIAGVSFFYFDVMHIKPRHPGDYQATLVHEQNPNGRKSVILLKDGSRVTLNADSKISYPTTFDSTKREVYLEGEAFFEVAKDAERPFQVITGEIKTVALGTSFNIKSYPEDSNIEVSLLTGKVKIQHHKTFKVLDTLVPGELITYQKESGMVQKNEVPTSDISVWKRGVLQFDHAHPEEVFKTLERWYGVHIEIHNKSLARLDVNGKFENESIENVLDILQYSMKFNFRKDQDTITITYDN